MCLANHVFQTLYDKNLPLASIFLQNPADRNIIDKKCYNLSESSKRLNFSG